MSNYVEDADTGELYILSDFNENSKNTALAHLEISEVNVVNYNKTSANIYDEFNSTIEAQKEEIGRLKAELAKKNEKPPINFPSLDMPPFLYNDSLLRQLDNSIINYSDANAVNSLCCTSRSSFHSLNQCLCNNNHNYDEHIRLNTLQTCCNNKERNLEKKVDKKKEQIVLILISILLIIGILLTATMCVLSYKI